MKVAPPARSGQATLLVWVALASLSACMAGDSGAATLNGVWLELNSGQLSGRCVRVVVQQVPWLPLAPGYTHLAGGGLVDCATGSNPDSAISGQGASPYADRIVLDLYLGTDTTTYHFDLTRSGDILTGSLTDPQDTLLGTQFRAVPLATGAIPGLYAVTGYQAPPGATAPTDTLDLEPQGSVGHFRVVSGAGCASQNVGEYHATVGVVVVTHYYSPNAKAACMVAGKDSLSVVGGQLVRRIIRPSAADTTKRDTIMEIYTRQ